MEDAGTAGGRPAPTDLVRAARRAARRAHAPYSGFMVGAALRDARGALFLGANIENASYPLGICAERVALHRWTQEGGAPIRQIALFTDTAEATTPCGLCRDAILRLAPEAEVFLAHRGGVRGPFPSRSWLPGGCP